MTNRIRGHSDPQQSFGPGPRAAYGGSDNQELTSSLRECLRLSFPSEVRKKTKTHIPQGRLYPLHARDAQPQVQH